MVIMHKKLRTYLMQNDNNNNHSNNTENIDVNENKNNNNYSVFFITPAKTTEAQSY